MKTTEELNKYLSDLIKADKYMAYQPMYKMKSSGFLIQDFAKFTDLQSGKKSKDPNDAAAYYLPPTPDTDGYFWHTIRDITYLTFHAQKPNLGAEYFYNMTDELRNEFIAQYMKYGNYTSNKIINTVLSFIMWGSGNYHLELNFYQAWYKKDIKVDILTFGTSVILDRLIDIRLYSLSLKKDYKRYGAGWKAGTLNCYELMKQYL